MSTQVVTLTPAARRVMSLREVPVIGHPVMSRPQYPAVTSVRGNHPVPQVHQVRVVEFKIR
jgi:hypothetical protein